MADTKISALPAVTAPSTAAVVPVVEGTTNKKMTIAQILGLATDDPSLRYLVSVKDFGAFGDGAANDTAAIQAAIAAVQAEGGGNLFVPTGEYRVTSLTIPDGPVVNLIGEGEQSVIKTTSATANLLSVIAWYARIERIKFMSTVTRTAGEFVRLLGAHTVAERCHFWGDYTGVYMSGVGAKALHNVFSEGANNARRIHASGGDTSQTIAFNLMNAQSPGVSAGIFVDNSAALKIYGNDIIGQGRCLHIAPGAGQSVFSLFSRDNFYDSAVIGIAIEPNGTGAVYRVSFNDDWASSHSTAGATLATSGSSTINGVDFDGLELNANGTDGIAMTGSGVTNIRIRNCPVRQNISAGVNLGAGVQNVLIDGMQAQPADGFGGNAYGVFINASANNFEIRNSNLTGQGTSAAQGFVPSATKVLSNNKGYVTEKEGTGSVAAGATTATIAHGLSYAPTRVQITLQDDPVGRVWIDPSTTNNTQFVVSLSGTVGYAIRFTWRATV